MSQLYKEYEHRVQYYETDQMGCVHHSNYIRWFEECRTDYLQYLGMGYDAMEAAGVVSPVLTVQAEYKSMTRFGETVKIQVAIKEYNSVRIRISYEIYDKDTNVLRCKGESSHCFLNREGRPLSLKKTYTEWDQILRAEMQKRS